jgi:hypothetical protein
MSNLDRRRFLKDVLGKLAQATGVVVLASASAPPAEAAESKPEGSESPPEDIRNRADLLTASGNLPPGVAEAEALGFLNIGVRRPGLGWRNGGWRVAAGVTAAGTTAGGTHRLAQWRLAQWRLAQWRLAELVRLRAARTRSR